MPYGDDIPEFTMLDPNISPTVPKMRVFFFVAVSGNPEPKYAMLHVTRKSFHGTFIWTLLCQVAAISA